MRACPRPRVEGSRPFVEDDLELVGVPEESRLPISSCLRPPGLRPTLPCCWNDRRRRRTCSLAVGAGHASLPLRLPVPRRLGAAASRLIGPPEARCADRAGRLRQDPLGSAGRSLRTSQQIVVPADAFACPAGLVSVSRIGHRPRCVSRQCLPRLNAGLGPRRGVAHRQGDCQGAPGREAASTPSRKGPPAAAIGPSAK